MLVGDRAATPVHAVADLDHRARQVDGLLQVHAPAGAGAQEGRDVHVGVAACGDITDDGVERFGIEPMAIDLGAHCAQRVERRRVRHRDVVVLGSPEGLPGAGRQAGLARCQQVGVDHVEGRDDALPTQAHFQSCLGFEALGTADMAVAAHVDHMLLQRVDAQQTQMQTGGVHHAISTRWPSRGTVADQPSSRSMRCRSASAGPASPWLR